MAVKGHITEWYADQGYGYVTPEQHALRIKFYRQDVSPSVNSKQGKLTCEFFSFFRTQSGYPCSHNMKHEVPDERIRKDDCR